MSFNLWSKITFILFSTVLAALILGCRSNEVRGEYTEGMVDLGAVDTSTSEGPKIVIHSAAPGAKKEEVAVAILSATRKLAPKNSGTGTDDTRGAGLAADEVLAGREVVLEGFSQEQATQVVQDLKKAGLNVTMR